MKEKLVVFDGKFLIIISIFLMIAGICYTLIRLEELRMEQIKFNIAVQQGVLCATKMNGWQENKIYALEKGLVFPKRERPEVCKNFERLMCWRINCKDRDQVKRCKAQAMCKQGKEDDK